MLLYELVIMGNKETAEAVTKRDLKLPAELGIFRIRWKSPLWPELRPEDLESLSH